jgi:hypothetical protein
MGTVSPEILSRFFWAGFKILNTPEEFRGSDFQSLRNLHDVLKAHVSFPSLDTADVGSMQGAKLRELFLAPSLPGAELPNSVPEIPTIPRGHELAG